MLKLQNKSSLKFTSSDIFLAYKSPYPAKSAMWAYLGAQINLFAVPVFLNWNL